MDPRIEEYLKKKYGDNFEQAAKDKYEESSSKATVGNFFGNIGEAIAGQKVGGVDAGYDQMKKQAKLDTVGKIDEDKKNYMTDYTNTRAMDQNKITDDQRLKDTDPNSEESKMARSLAVKMGMNPQAAASMTAAKFQQSSPVLQKMYEIEQKKLDRGEARSERAGKAQDKKDEKEITLKTPYGLANTADDAKQLKSADELKKSFDSKLQQMINLRTTHNGGALWNREAVARGKQLSSDLLLAYKDLAKLGVMSESDKQILTAIIPEDPLEYNSPLAAISGQDPILHKMEQFKKDSDDDFGNRVKNRVRGGGNYEPQAEIKIIKGVKHKKVPGGWEPISG